MIYRAKVRETEHLEVYKQVDGKSKQIPTRGGGGEAGGNVNLV